MPEQRLASSVMQAALERLRLEGAVFLRAEYREPWAYQSFAASDTAKILRPGAERVILFHVVASGTCWVAIDGGDKHWAIGGDVIVLPYGDQHCMGGVHEAETVSMASILPMPPWRELPVIRHGADGEQTDVVCGYLHSQDPLFDPGLRVFPPVFVVRPPPGPAAEWVRANVAYAVDQISALPAVPAGVMSRLPELLLVEALRLHLLSAPAVDQGWLAALDDPVLRPALALLHGAPARRWTVTGLAREAAVSQVSFSTPGSASCLADRLSVTSRSGACTWRRTCSRRLMLGVAAVAHRVGYDAEEAFSRAFKRVHGDSPTSVAFGASAAVSVWDR